MGENYEEDPGSGGQAMSDEISRADPVPASAPLSLLLSFPR